MTEEFNSSTYPRWGQYERDRKAEAIRATLLSRCGYSIDDGLWLDIGCGSGDVAATFASHVRQVVGVDPEPWDRWSGIREMYSNIELHAGSYGDIEKLLDMESVDVVVCNQVYEHVDNPSALLRAIHRVMKPGGVCYFAGPNWLWPIEPHVKWPFVHWLPRKVAQNLMRSLGSARAERLDARSWPYWRLIREFTTSGYEYSIAIHDRLLVSASAQGAGRFARIAASIPRVLVDGLAWCSPGFIFILTKPS